MTRSAPLRSRVARHTPALVHTRRPPATFQHNLFFCILALVLMGSLFALDVRRDAFSAHLLTSISFLAVGVLSFLGLYDSARDHTFSLNISHWTYLLIFLFYAPFVQFLVSFPPAQSDIGIFDDYALWVNCLTLVWIFVYTFCYSSKSKDSYPNPSSRPLASIPKTITCSNWTYLIVVLLCAASFFSLYFLFGLEAVLLRGAGSSITDKAADKSSFLIFNSISRGLPSIATGMLLLTRGKSKWAHWTAFSIALLFTLVMNNPVAVARFWFGSVMLGFCCLYIYIKQIKLSGLWLPLALTLAGVTIFPVLSATRYAASASDLSKVQVNNDDWSSNLTSPDFDGYSMIMNTMEWTRREGTTHGGQLFGNTLFFVPRVLWYDKPIGSGQEVAEYFDLININMAEPMTAEAYINFGFWGIPLYAFAIARLFSYTDKRYWKIQHSGDISILMLLYPFITSLAIYLLRGDYISGLSSTLSLLFSCVLLLWVFRATAVRAPKSGASTIRRYRSR